MINIKINGFGDVKLEHVVSDYNGTLAHDGFLIEGVKERLAQLAQLVTVHIITADTFGRAASQLQDSPVKLHIISAGNEDEQKVDYVKNLSEHNVAAFGNGNNDRKMLEAARLGIAVMEGEGCAAKTILAADIVVSSILAGLDVLLHPKRCKASLRY